MSRQRSVSSKCLFKKLQIVLIIAGLFVPCLSPASVTAAFSSTTATPEIKALARALKNDPQLIYDYVRNHIDYTPYFGSLKGAGLTLLSGSGNDFDQASLMISLLRESGNASAQFYYGLAQFNLDDIAQWLGVESRMLTVFNTLSLAGIPVIEANFAENNLTIRVAMVKVNLNGTDYLAFPAYNTYESSTGIEIGSALRYEKSELITAASTSAVVDNDGIGVDFVQGLDESGIRNKLKELSNNLVREIRQNHPNTGIKEILGGRSIAESPASFVEFNSNNGLWLWGESPSFSAFPPGEPAYGLYLWDEIPDETNTYVLGPHKLIAKLTININNQDTYVFDVPQVAGKRLTVSFSDTTLYPELNLDGARQQPPGNITPSAGQNYTCTLSIDHPYLSNYLDYSTGEIMYADHGAFDQDNSSQPYQLKSGINNVYAIISDFGNSTSDALLLERQKNLSKSLAEQYGSFSEPVLGESLNLIGLNWLKEGNDTDRLLNGLSDSFNIRHHALGLVAQHDTYYVSVDLIYDARCRKTLGSGLSTKSYAVARTLKYSAFEHGVLEQMKDTGVEAVSTIKLLQAANENSGTKIYSVNSDNLESIRSQLLGNGYTEADYYGLLDLVYNGYSLILPGKGDLQLGDWVGQAFAAYSDTDSYQVGMIISNGLSGGYPTSLSDPLLNSDFINEYQLHNSHTAYSPETISCHAVTFPLPRSKDPVDMAGGAFLHDRTDLALGGPAPLGLAFGRSYSSSNISSDIGLGPGWTHNYDILLRETSNPAPGLGSRLPVEAAPMIAALYVTLDLLENQDDILGWTTSALVSKWAIDQLINNSVTAVLGSKTMEFIKLPDGSFSPPPGITTNLVKNGSDNTYSLKERFGTELKFNTQNRIEKWTDADSNIMNFNYNGDHLDYVEDAFGRRLTFTYSGERLQSVADSTGRSVSFGYDAEGNLDTYTDPELKNWTYGYDPAKVCCLNPPCEYDIPEVEKKQLMTSLTNGAGITTAVNTYDCQGKVDTQTVKRVNTSGILSDFKYNLYFSGFRNIEEEDATGNQTIYYLDRKGRPIAEENALGHHTTTKYDGQDHIIETTDAKGNTTRYRYDGYNNLVQVINARNETTVYAYDDPGIPGDEPLLPLTLVTDPLQHQVRHKYDPAKFHLLDTITYPAPGVEVTTSATYNERGLPQTATDGNRTAVATTTYDGYGNPDKIQVNSHPQVDYDYNAIGLLTQVIDQENIGKSEPSKTHFAHNNRGQVTLRTDPLGKSTIFDYDDNGNLWKKTDRKGNLLTYTYTPSNKLWTITYPVGASNVMFDYNEQDRLKSMTDWLGTTEYTEYDELGRLKSAKDPHGFIVQYNYDTVQTANDQAGNLTRITYPSNKSVTYTYDELNRLETVTLDWLGLTATYEYDAAGRLKKLTNFNATVVDYAYDDASRLTSLRNLAGATPIAKYQFVDLDGNGNPRKILTDEPVMPVIPTTPTAFTYNDPKNRLQTVNGASLTYDDEGQLQTGHGSDYTFDYEHRLTKIGQDTEFFYDGMGNRLKAVRGQETTYYVYDLNGNLIAEADGNKSITRYYIYGAGLMAMVTAADNSIYCYHFNAIGSTVSMTDINQNLVNKYAYTPFATFAAVEEAIPQPFKFVGRYGVMSEPNGFYYMRARYYDPISRRFISEDPLGFGGGDLNLYAYVGNNPVMFVDPNGNIALSTVALVGYVSYPYLVRYAPIIYRSARSAYIQYAPAAVQAAKWWFGDGSQGPSGGRGSEKQFIDKAYQVVNDLTKQAQERVSEFLDNQTSTNSHPSGGKRY